MGGLNASTGAESPKPSILILFTYPVSCFPRLFHFTCHYSQRLCICPKLPRSLRSWISHRARLVSSVLISLVPRSRKLLLCKLPFFLLSHCAVSICWPWVLWCRFRSPYGAPWSEILEWIFLCSRDANSYHIKVDARGVYRSTGPRLSRREGYAFTLSHCYLDSRHTSRAICFRGKVIL